GVAAGRRVARVADRELAAQARETALVEDLRHEAEVAHDRQAAVLADRDPRRLLAAMLQRVEPEVREARDVAACRADSEDAAHLDLPQLDRVRPVGLLRGGDDHALAVAGREEGDPRPRGRLPQGA